jgi:hypothetical protein
MDLTYLDKLECDCRIPISTQLFSFIGIFQIGMLLASIPVAFILHKMNYNIDTTETETEEVQPISYTEMYPIEKATQEPDIILSKHSYIIECTPVGIVIMRYDEDDEGFLYWTNKSINYEMLDVVARKYVTQFCCKDVFIDRMKLLKEKKQMIEDEKARQKEQVLMDTEDADAEADAEAEADADADAEADAEADEIDVFADFKSYNKKGNNDNETSENTTDKNTIVAEKSNKFIKKGSISDFDFSATSEKKIIPENQKIDFNTFKNLFWKTKTSNEKLD